MGEGGGHDKGYTGTSQEGGKEGCGLERDVQVKSR